MRQDLLRSIENFLWQTGQPRHLDAVTLVCAAGNDLAQENDLLVPFPDRDVEIADAFAFLGELGQLVIVRREECARLDFVVQKFGDAPGNR